MHGLFGIFYGFSTCQQALVVHLYGCLRMNMHDFMAWILISAYEFSSMEFFYDRRHSTDARLMGYACHGQVRAYGNRNWDDTPL